MGWEARGWSSSDGPQLQSSTVHHRWQELQLVAAAITQMIFDLISSQREAQTVGQQ